MIIILCDVLTLCFTVNLYEKKEKECFGVLIFLVENYLCLNVYTKNLEEKKLIITIDIVEYKILWMRASLMRGFRMDGGRTVRDPPSQFPRLCDNQDPPSTGEKYMICTWVFSGIYNPSRMALYGVHTWSH